MKNSIKLTKKHDHDSSHKQKDPKYEADDHHSPFSLHKINCVYHRDQIITNFCKSLDCLMPLCPECVKIHTEDHTKIGNYGVYETIDEVWFTIMRDIEAIEENYSKAKSKLHLAQNNNENGKAILLSHLHESKKKLIRIIDDFYRGIEAEINETQSFHSKDDLIRLDFTHSKIIERLQDLQKLKKKLKGSKFLKYIIIFISSNVLNEHMTYVQQIHAHLNQMNSRLTYFRDEIQPNYIYNFLSQYLSLENKRPPTPLILNSEIQQHPPPPPPPPLDPYFQEKFSPPPNFNNSYIHQNTYNEQFSPTSYPGNQIIIREPPTMNMRGYNTPPHPQQHFPNQNIPLRPPQLEKLPPNSPFRNQQPQPFEFQGAPVLIGGARPPPPFTGNSTYFPNHNSEQNYENIVKASQLNHSSGNVFEDQRLSPNYMNINNPTPQKIIVNSPAKTRIFNTQSQSHLSGIRDYNTPYSLKNLNDSTLHGIPENNNVRSPFKPLGNEGLNRFNHPETLPEGYQSRNVNESHPEGYYYSRDQWRNV